MIIALVGAVDDMTFSGRRLAFVNNPLLIRLRWMIIGGAISSVLFEVQWDHMSIGTWCVLAVFLLTMVKVKVLRVSDQQGSG